MALIGVDEDTVDNNWFAFFSQLASQSFPDADMIEGQHGMGWDIEVTINADGVTEVKDLAYIDPRSGERTITYRVRQYDPAPGPDPAGISTLTRSWHVVTKTEPVDASGALGAFYSGVSQSDIDSTRRSRLAIDAARIDLERAYQEMQVAITVANTAWTGTRADPMKFRLGLEADITASIAEVCRTWDGFMRDLVVEQGKAKAHDEQLVGEVVAEIAIAVVAGIITFGIGSAVGSAFVAARLAHWAHEVAAVRAIISSKFATRAAAAARTTAGSQAVRVLARGTGDLTARAGVAGIRDDKELSGQDILLSYGIAGVLGQGTSEFGKAVVKRIEAAHGVTFAAPTFGAVKGGVQGTPRGGVNAVVNGVATDAALAKVTSSLALGVPLEALKETQKRAVTQRIFSILQGDKAARRAAQERIIARDPGAFSGTQSTLDDFREGSGLVDAELKAQAERLVNPVLDYAYGAGGGAVVAGTASTIDGSPGDPTSSAGGHVPPPR